MGVIYSFCCPKCHYEAKASKGLSRGMLAAVKPMVCDDCNELQNITVAYFDDWDSKPIERPVQECEHCYSRNLKDWEDANCPKCGTSMGDGEVFMMWD